MIRSQAFTGEERIIAMRSGSFGSGRPSRVRIWRLAADGALLETDPPWRDIQGRIPIATPEGGIVVIEREGIHCGAHRTIEPGVWCPPRR